MRKLAIRSATAFLTLAMVLAASNLGGGATRAVFAQNSLPAPTNFTARPSGLEGEIDLRWNAVARATHYWICQKKSAESGSDAWDCSKTLHTNFHWSGFTVGVSYDFAVQAERETYSYTIRSGWVYAQATAETATAHLCPITGLPVSAEGYLGVGDTVSGIADTSFTLTSATTPAGVTLNYADDPTQLFSPRVGRRFVKVCGTFRHKYDGASWLEAGYDTIIDTDTGIGFAVSTTHQRLEPGVAGNGCQIWDVPTAAKTAIYAVGFGAYDTSRGVVGTDVDSIGLYNISLP